LQPLSRIEVVQRSHVKHFNLFPAAILFFSSATSLERKDTLSRSEFGWLDACEIQSHRWIDAKEND